MDNCKLCGKHYERFPKSHIIPEFMYKSLKNEKSQIQKLSMPSGKRLKPSFTGFYEKPLLCFDCERKINVWESYAEKILYGSKQISMPTSMVEKETSMIFVENVDYNYFKLFLLSILFRSSVARHVFFEGVALGYKHEKRLAELLNNSDAGAEDEYPVLIMAPEGTVGTDVGILPPYRRKSDENATRYIFPISELIYVFHISPHGMDQLQKDSFLRKTNTLKVLKIPLSRARTLIELYNVKQHRELLSKRNIIRPIIRK